MTMKPEENALSASERVVLEVLAESFARTAQPVAGHDLRLAVQQRGVAKPAVVLAMQALVERGVLQRVRCEEADGRFFTAYRLMPKA
ncbi:MAG TPA: hypothetical protein VF271_10460 [Rhodanobacteraceae bacterium]